MHGKEFISYGAHIDNYKISYLTVAASIGMTNEEVDEFCSRLLKTAASLKKKILIN